MKLLQWHLPTRLYSSTPNANVWLAVLGMILFHNMLAAAAGLAGLTMAATISLGRQRHRRMLHQRRIDRAVSSWSGGWVDGGPQALHKPSHLAPTARTSSKPDGRIQNGAPLPESTQPLSVGAAHAMAAAVLVAQNQQRRALRQTQDVSTQALPMDEPQCRPASSALMRGDGALGAADPSAAFADALAGENLSAAEIDTPAELSAESTTQTTAWRSSINVGYPQLDAHRDRLFDICLETAEWVAHGDAKPLEQSPLDELQAHLGSYLLAESGLLEKAGRPLSTLCQRQRDAMLRCMQTLAERARAGETVASEIIKFIFHDLMADHLARPV